MKILITGGAGFIGSHLANTLDALEHEVIVLDNLTGGFPENLNCPGPRLVVGDIRDVSLVDGLFESYKFDVVYHLAAYAAEGLSHWIRRFNYDNNVVGSMNIINASIKHKIKHFIFTSSMAVYGDKRPPFRESDDTSPIDPYGVAKDAVEKDLYCAKLTHGLNYTVFRPHNVIGINQNIWDKNRNVVGIFMSQVLNNQSMTIFGDGTRTRAFSKIDSVIGGMLKYEKLNKSGHNTFNIGGGVTYSINYLANMIDTISLQECTRVHLSARHEAVHAYCDHTRIKDAWPDFNDSMDMELELTKIWNWAKSVHKRREVSTIYNLELDNSI